MRQCLSQFTLNGNNCTFWRKSMLTITRSAACRITYVFFFPSALSEGNEKIVEATKQVDTGITNTSVLFLCVLTSWQSLVWLIGLRWGGGGGQGGSRLGLFTFSRYLWRYLHLVVFAPLLSVPPLFLWQGRRHADQTGDRLSWAGLKTDLRFGGAVNNT